MFLDNYVKQTADTKILLVYLLLNNHSMEVVDKNLEEVEEDKQFGLQLRKVYALTKEHIDCGRIYREIEKIQVPIICSQASYEYYAESPYIYCYTAKDKSKRLVINDMGVISKTMVITEDLVISDNYAENVLSADAVSGFPYFVSYVLYNGFRVGKWSVLFKDNVFIISYNDAVIYSAKEIDKTSTYKMVIYLIRKASVEQDTIVADNFECEKYRKRASV